MGNKKIRVIVIKSGALGDLVSVTSIIGAFKSQFGDNTLIDFVTNTGTASIFTYDERVNVVYTLKHKKLPIFLSPGKQAIIKASKKNSYDYLINFEKGKQYKQLIHQIRAKHKVGYNTENLHLNAQDIHMVDVSKSIYKGIIDEKIYLNSFPQIFGVKQVELQNKFTLPLKYIVLSPSNSHQRRSILNYRAWQDNSWKELIQQLSKQITIVIVGDKREHDFFQKLQPYPNNVIDLAGKTSLPELISVIQFSTALVSTDTGTAHIGSAVANHIFTLIGPTQAEGTGPYKTPYNTVHIISVNKECAPCYGTQVMKECKENVCMKEITPLMVLDHINAANIL